MGCNFNSPVVRKDMNGDEYHGMPDFSGQPFVIYFNDKSGKLLKFCRIYVSKDPKHDSHLSFANEKSLYKWLSGTLLKS